MKKGGGGALVFLFLPRPGGIEVQIPGMEHVRQVLKANWAIKT